MVADAENDGGDDRDDGEGDKNNKPNRAEDDVLRDGGSFAVILNSLSDVNDAESWEAFYLAHDEAGGVRHDNFCKGTGDITAIVILREYFGAGEGIYYGEFYGGGFVDVAGVFYQGASGDGGGERKTRDGIF